MRLTIPELAHAVGKSENYVRQHINRKHLAVQRDGRNIFVAHDEAARWARERHLPFVLPPNAWPSTAAIQMRTARMAVLTQNRPGERLHNLLTVLRHRRQDALGPWSNEPSKTWTTEDLGNGLRLFSLDATLEHCQALIEDILDSGTFAIEGDQINYALEPISRRRWAFRDQYGLAEAAMISPFSQHSAEILEYWSLAPEPRRHWLNVLDSGHGHAPLPLSRLGVPLDRLTDRVGNLIIAGAERCNNLRSRSSARPNTDAPCRRGRTFARQISRHGLGQPCWRRCASPRSPRHTASDSDRACIRCRSHWLCDIPDL